MVSALGVIAIRCALLATLRSLPAILLIQLLHSPAVALLWTAALAHLKQRTVPQTFATAQGIFAAVIAAGGVAGNLLWGALYPHLGGRCTFALAAVVAASSVALALHWTVRARS